MKYEHITEGRFIDRPNRFIAHVEINGQVETVHVKNTGRCRELLVPGCLNILFRLLFRIFLLFCCSTNKTMGDFIWFYIFAIFLTTFLSK